MSDHPDPEGWINYITPNGIVDRPASPRLLEAIAELTELAHQDVPADDPRITALAGEIGRLTRGTY